MKKLLVLWDPETPTVLVGPVVHALRERVELGEITFQQVSHRTSPNRKFEIRPIVDQANIDGILWIEGGPLPADIEKCPGEKACWLVNAYHEPTIINELAPLFNRRLVATIEHSADEACRWLPLASGNAQPPQPPQGFILVVDDPKPSSHAEVQRALDGVVQQLPIPEKPVVMCLGTGNCPNTGMFDWMRSGSVVVVNPECDLRGLANAGDHLLDFPQVTNLSTFLQDLFDNREVLLKVAERAPAIVEHLHTPEIRAEQIVDAIWPRHRILGDDGHHATVSVLVTCYKYLRRFRFCLESLARQNLPPGTLEIVVVDPESPDGLAEYLETFAAKNTNLSVVHLPINPRYHRNRGICINRAFDASTGKIIISIDSDIIFPPHLIRALVDLSEENPQAVLGIRRVFLDKEITADILENKLDPFRDFDQLAQSPGDGEQHAFSGVLGYCQVTQRRAFAIARYPEEFDMVNQSDIIFNERLEKYAQVLPRYIGDLSVLHLWHPRNWEGTEDYL